MWKKIHTLTEHPIVQFLKKLCGDPVQIYTVFLMVTVMYYYHQKMTWLYAVISVFLSFVLMKFYDFVKNHKWLGPVCYLGYLAAGLWVSGFIIDFGEIEYPISYLVWFLTPQSVVDFSLWYTIATFMLMMGFLSSTVYYFSKVRYRMLMQFIIMMIPLSLYAKEGLQMPALLVILLLGSYFLLMVYCRQIRYTSQVKYLPSLSSGMSVAAYVLSFSILAAVVPKPHVNADREFIENAMAYSTLSDVLMNAISMFTSVTDGGNAGSTSLRTLYRAEAPTSLRLGTQTFSYYHENDTWSVDDYYDYPTHEFSEMFLYSPETLLSAIAEAAKQDSTFAETYGLAFLTETSIPSLPAMELRLTPMFYPSYLVPMPTRLAGWKTQYPGEKEHLSSLQNTTSLYNTSYLRYAQLRMEYYPDDYSRNAAVNEMLRHFSSDTYADLLADAVQVLAESEPETAAFLEQCCTENEMAFRFLEDAEENDFQSDEIDRLAVQLTEGMTSDYEKAAAIERYFTDAGYVYDLGYVKESGDNVVDFLTESHTGVCYEYATAMVLLCRSIGLPARYVQGYSMADMTEQATPLNQYRIHVKDSHAFPEVYISGYGWLSFEPTVAAMEEEGAGILENHYVMLWGFGILGLTGIAVLLLLAMPAIRENLFRRRLSGMQQKQAASAVFRHMRKILGLSESATVSETAGASAPFCTDEIRFAQMFQTMDSLLYAPDDAKSSTMEIAEAYAEWFEKRKAWMKQQKELQKQEAKANKRHKS